MAGIIFWGHSRQWTDVKRRSYLVSRFQDSRFTRYTSRLLLRLLECSSEGFQFPALRLTLQPPLLRPLRRLRGSAFLARDGHALNELPQSSESILSILLLASILLGFDGDHALL